jgi:hypothetical protein
LKKISDFFDIDEAKKNQRERERRIKYRAQRAPPRTEPSPPPIPSKRAPRTKAERRALWGRKQPSTEPSVSTAPPPPTNQPKKRKQYQQTNSENLQKTIEYWDNFKGGDKITKASVARMFGIERKTFANYVCDDLSKQKLVGSKPGRKSIINASDTEFIAQHTARADRANEGLTSKEIVQNVISLRAGSEHELTLRQAQNWVYRTLRSSHPDLLKPNLMRVQKTMSKRSSCDVAQQWRWMKMFEAGLNYLHANNTGVCRKTGKLFGELIEHFVIGSDEACLMADDHGDLHTGARTTRTGNRFAIHSFTHPFTNTGLHSITHAS